MIKRLLSIILAITMVVSLLPTTVFAVEYYGGTISSDVEESDDTIYLNADTTIAEGVTFTLTSAAHQYILIYPYVLTNYGTIATANSSKNLDGGTFYNYGVCEITVFYDVTIYDLTLSSIALSSGTLSPSFAAGTREYAVTVDNSVTSIDITPTLNTGTGVKSITVNGTTATSGATSTVSLDVGENSIPIVITAGDGSDTTNTYTLTVTRASAADYTITNALFVSTGTSGISQDMLQWSNVDAPGGYNLEIYTESGAQVYSDTLTNNYISASEVLTSSGTYYFTIYALDAYGNELSSKTSSVFTYSHTHSYEAVVTEPTCTTGGYTTYTCSVCGDSYTADETEATGHSWDEGTVTTEATCTEDGEKTYTCTVCGENYAVSIAKIAHTAGEATVENEVPATHTTDGSYDSVVYCLECGAEISRETITVPANVHTAGEPVVENEVSATCTEDGSFDIVVYCTECGEEIGRETITVPATGHTAGEPTVENEVSATCTEDGSFDSVVYCTECGVEISRETITVPATGHTYVDIVTAPTCTEQGYTTHKCSVCNYSYVDTYTTALGHSYEATVTAPTCTEKGYTTYTCSICGDYYTADEVEATGHSYEAVVTDPTCTEQGYTTHTCSVCGNSYVDDYVDALGHTTEIQNAKDATCTEDGYTGDEVCTVCGETVTAGEVIPATGHTYGEPVFTWNGNTCTATFTCTCGDVQTVDATVTSKNFFGMVTRTAEVTFESSTYTDTKTTGRSLLTIMADYTSVNEAISKANALNASDYSNFADVTAAINAVQWNLNVLNQSTVNGYAEAIETAISNLKAAELTEETVTINEPIEDTNTETEPDDIEVDDTDEETNPTTGIALAMLPMAVALAGVVINKRK